MKLIMTGRRERGGRREERGREGRERIKGRNKRGREETDLRGRE